MDTIRLTTRSALRGVSSSALTFPGMSLDKENLKAVHDWLAHVTPSRYILEICIVKGDLMNRVYRLTGENAYPEDYGFLIVANDYICSPRMLSSAIRHGGCSRFGDIVRNDLLCEKKDLSKWLMELGVLPWSEIKAVNKGKLKNSRFAPVRWPDGTQMKRTGKAV